MTKKKENKHQYLQFNDIDAKLLEVTCEVSVGHLHINANEKHWKSFFVFADDEHIYFVVVKRWNKEKRTETEAMLKLTECLKSIFFGEWSQILNSTLNLKIIILMLLMFFLFSSFGFCPVVSAYCLFVLRKKTQKFLNYAGNHIKSNFDTSFAVLKWRNWTCAAHQVLKTI